MVVFIGERKYVIVRTVVDALRYLKTSTRIRQVNRQEKADIGFRKLAAKLKIMVSQSDIHWDTSPLTA